jgi:hypothetical protein
MANFFRSLHLWPRRKVPTLFVRCLACHMAEAGKLSALK